MNHLFPERILSIAAHPDDTEMHHIALLGEARQGYALVATGGEATTLNYDDSPHDIVQLRRAESEQALAFHGITGYWLDLPDGELSRTRHVRELARAAVQIALRHDIDALATLGHDGFCGHPDHIAAHHAALAAQQTLATHHDVDVRLYMLDIASDHVHVPVDRERKLAGIALHASQFKTVGGTVDPLFWQRERAALYDPLLERESYRVA